MCQRAGRQRQRVPHPHGLLQHPVQRQRVGDPPAGHLRHPPGAVAVLRARRFTADVLRAGHGPCYWGGLCRAGALHLPHPPGLREWRRITLGVWTFHSCVGCTLPLDVLSIRCPNTAIRRPACADSDAAQHELRSRNLRHISLDQPPEPSRPPPLYTTPSPEQAASSRPFSSLTNATLPLSYSVSPWCQTGPSHLIKAGQARACAQGPAWTTTSPW